MVVFEPSRYKNWEELYVSTDKGKREVHYFLKRRNGSGSDLVVVGKETTLRHFSYRYAFPGKSLASLSKLRSRREVVDWLDSIVNSEIKACKSVGSAHTATEGNNDVVEGPNVVKKLPTKQLLWVGSPWTCRKRRTHYPSFCRNGVNISVHDFVYVLAEEGKQLIAHLYDMYEDSKGNKMVVVQWFHKIDEVGTDLPQHYYDREIYFSLCLQDLSIECIDGLATVLSPEHYETYLNGATRSQMEPFVCHRLFDNDEVKSFDVTKVKGYWEQDLVKCFDSQKKHHQVDDGQAVEKQFTDADENRPRKRLRKSGKALQSDNKKVDVGSLQKFGGSLVGSKSKGQMGLGGVLREIPPSLPNKSAVEQKNQHLSIGSKVEVLSEDSGIRGCWFRAMIVKKHKDKVRVQYQDIMDAFDETKNLEEWILALKIAASDGLGTRISGRTTVRPAPKSPNGNVTFNIGTIVDVYRHDGWWEGIVVRKEPKDRFRVYFPGEKQESVFSCADIRISQEWFEDCWNQLKERPDLASKISGRGTKPAAAINTGSVDPKTDSNKENKQPNEAPAVQEEKKQPKEAPAVREEKKQPNEAPAVRDLSKDEVLLQLKWKSSGRRRCNRSPVHKLNFVVHDSRRKRADDPNKQAASYHGLFDMASMKGKGDLENCKGDTGFSSSAVTNLTSMVVTR